MVDWMEKGKAWALGVDKTQIQAVAKGTKAYVRVFRSAHIIK